VTLPAFAAERQQLSIDTFCQQGPQQQTRRPPLLLSIDGTDGRTPDRYVDLPAHTVSTASVTVWIESDNCVECSVYGEAVLSGAVLSVGGGGG